MRTLYVTISCYFCCCTQNYVKATGDIACGNLEALTGGEIKCYAQTDCALEDSISEENKLINSLEVMELLSEEETI